LVEGHTDSDGSNEMNQTLSENRAAAVKNYRKNGIKADRLNSTGFGETKPMDTNKTSAGKTHNRRVEISLIKNNFLKYLQKTSHLSVFFFKTFFFFIYVGTLYAN
jgi:flagellar motor protein MotB